VSKTANAGLLAGTVFGIVLLSWALWFAGVALTGWVVMLLLGVVHSALPAVPALGYWVTVAIVGVISLVLGLIKKAFHS
jgi:hypothetical protein